MKKVALMQPYLFPYIGYFQLINCVDTFVIYDDAQWMKGGWINRNRILVGGAATYITIPIKKGFLTDKIADRILAENVDSQKSAILKDIEFEYESAPYFHDVHKLIRSIFSSEETNASSFIVQALQKCCEYLSIETPIILSSDLKKTPNLKGQARVIDICKTVGATHYINAIGGIELYDKTDFRKEGIELSFIKTGEIKYEQFGKEFMPNLSIIDVMMFNSPETIKKILGNYELV